ncbi:MAG: hypothetical protein PHG02_05825, partial [Oscillospiraceae bacterium]|nr:hypothetical protein [Oscillospiraceae bacterium]
QFPSSSALAGAERSSALQRPILTLVMLAHKHYSVPVRGMTILLLYFNTVTSFLLPLLLQLFCYITVIPLFLSATFFCCFLFAEALQIL